MYYNLREKNGQYLCTARLRVLDQETARRFRTIRQAKLFLQQSGLDIKDFEIEEHKEM